MQEIARVSLSGYEVGRSWLCGRKTIVHEQATENSVMSAEYKDGGEWRMERLENVSKYSGNKVGFRRPLRGLF